MPATGRSYVSGVFALELDGLDEGYLRSVSGGDAYGDVVVEPAGIDGVAHKHVANVAYSDIVLSCASVGSELAAWISDLCNGKQQSRAGAVMTYDFNRVELERLSFKRAWLREVAFPRLDAASKDAAALAVKMAPEYTLHSAGTGKKAPALAKQAQKTWLPSDFRLTIGGLDCTRVNRIEPIVVRQQVAEDAVGELRTNAPKRTGIEISDLVVTFNATSLPSWQTWHEDFLINGNSGPAQEKTATLELLGPSMKNVWLTIVLKGLGIHKLRAVQTSGSDVIRRFTAHMYCEEIAVSLTPAAVANAPANTTQALASNGFAVSAGGTPSRVVAIPPLEMPLLADLADARPVFARVRPA